MMKEVENKRMNKTEQMALEDMIFLLDNYGLLNKGWDNTPLEEMFSMIEKGDLPSIISNERYSLTIEYLKELSDCCKEILEDKDSEDMLTLLEKEIDKKSPLVS